MRRFSIWSGGAEPGEASGTKGLEFMAEMNKAGNFVPVSAKSGTIAQGQTPVVAASLRNAAGIVGGALAVHRHREKHGTDGQSHVSKKK